MTDAAAPAATAPTAEGRAADDLRLARIHLRMGQLTLARAELEDLLGRDALDATGLAVLAEARWRTGDAQGAAAAAEAHLEAGGIDAIAISIAAEAAAAEGRPGDARVLMERMAHADAATLDTIFAGMPRRASWPAGPVDHAQLEEIRREAERGAAWTPAYRPADLATPSVGGTLPPAAAPRTASRDPQGRTAGMPSAGVTGVASQTVPGPRDVLEATGEWAGATAGAAAPAPARGQRTSRPAGRRAKASLDPRTEVQRARAELDARPEQALLRLALVLRADPTLAPLVLDAVHMRREPGAVLLRGDAERLLGRHLEAEAAFDSVAESLER